MTITHVNLPLKLIVCPQHTACLFFLTMKGILRLWNSGKDKQQTKLGMEAGRGRRGRQVPYKKHSSLILNRQKDLLISDIITPFIA